MIFFWKRWKAKSLPFFLKQEGRHERKAGGSVAKRKFDSIKSKKRRPCLKAKFFSFFSKKVLLFLPGFVIINMVLEGVKQNWRLRS